MKVAGTVIRADFGPGVYLLEGDDGARYALHAEDASLLREGLRATVEGELQEVAGIGLTGDPVLRVERVVQLD